MSRSGVRIRESDDPQTAIDELLDLLINRRGFLLVIQSDHDQCTVSISDAATEMTGAGADFSAAWLDLAVDSDEQTIEEILHQVSIWTDLAQAAIDAECAPPRTYASYLAWLLGDDLVPAEMALALPG